MDKNTNLYDLKKLVQAEYAGLIPETEIGRQNNQRILDDLEYWFEIEGRTISQTSYSCIERFIDAELDAETEGKRGLGRMSDFEPRFAAKYRSTFQENSDAAKLLKPLFLNHVYLGYLFVEYLLEASANRQLARDPTISDSYEVLFKQWVPLLYSSAGASSFDESMEQLKGKEAYWRIKSLWMNGTLRHIKSTLSKLNIITDFQDDVLLLRYFDSGLTLRLLESRPLSTQEQIAVITGGASEAERPTQVGKQSAGCSIIFIVSLVAAICSVKSYI